MKQIEVKKYRPVNSKHCFIIRKGWLVEHLSSIYGRQVALKIFDDVSVETPEDMYTVKWGDDPAEGEPRVNTTLWEASQIQNIASWYGLAPRVFGLETVFLGRAYRPVQVVEYLEESYHDINDAHKVYSDILRLGEKYHFGVGKHDVSADDAINGKLIDFQTFAFNQDYKDTVKDIYYNDGRYGKIYYQSVPELEMHGGPRNSELRIKELGLDQIDFKGKTVWDVGCAGGFFTRYAIDRGAKRVIGFDNEPTVNAARNMANYLGYFNADYEVVDLNKDKVLMDWARPDIVLLLSMNYHIGVPEFLKACPFVVFEDNGKESRNFDQLGGEFATWFENHKLIGRNSDHGGKPIYHIWH